MQPVTLGGVVTQFQGNGRKLGYPTANIHTDTPLDDGVYFGRANLQVFKEHPALVFIGVPTTVGDTKRRLEVHLLDIPDEDYYDTALEVTLLEFYRPNQTFRDVTELQMVMKADEVAARDWFAARSEEAAA
jgi:riboflavin kinase/FMN adenylyltransferase